MNNNSGFQPGRTKTGGRVKGSGGRRMFLTIPQEFKLPDGEAEARAVVIEALREFFKRRPPTGASVWETGDAENPE